MLLSAILSVNMATPVFAVQSEEQSSASLYSRSVDADHEQTSARSVTKREFGLYGIRNKNLQAYPSKQLYHNGESLGSMAVIINGSVYIPIREFVEKITNLKVTYYSSSGTITVTGNGHNISVSNGAYVMYANDRVLFTLTPSVIMTNGRMYVPMSSLIKALSLSFTESNSSVSTRGVIAPIKHASSYYDADSVYWLSRIISAESRGESLLGQIAVGTVIMNRVRSNQFPNTIWGVIFDRKYGLQFSPVGNGTIYNTPAYTSVLAAKICLEGFSVDKNIVYFVAPRVVPNSWIQRNRQYEFTIGNHDFYS